MRIRNLDGANDLRVMFYGDTFITVKPGLEEEFSGDIPFFTVQSSAGSVQWEAHAVVAA
jgi:hypothetical protein